ncbi:MAG: hypothetical protein KGZ25_05380 [Planctomycetes bacterium]|nr:hypothetical protein [Planctomycetota bacterium]
MTQYAEMTLRPYDILCSICALGDDQSEALNEKFATLISRIRRNPDIPIALRCNVGGAFSYQDIGTESDTPEGSEFNVRRDLEVLHKLNLPPGCVLPARIIFTRAFDGIESVEGICGYATATSEAWEGCPRADTGCYEKGRAKGIEALIPPRDEDEMKREKEKSLETMYDADAISIRPHILLCAVCQYGSGVRPPYAPDNLPELMQLILDKPATLIKVASHADWMMCAPCPDRVPETNACVTNKGSGGLPNQMRDLRVLQKLGMTYGDTIEARELYKRIFERIPGTFEICALDHCDPSIWYTSCGIQTSESENYDKGRRMLMENMEIEPSENKEINPDSP